MILGALRYCTTGIVHWTLCVLVILDIFILLLLTSKPDNQSMKHPRNQLINQWFSQWMRQIVNREANSLRTTDRTVSLSPTVTAILQQPRPEVCSVSRCRVCGDGVDVKVLDLWHAATTRGTAYIAAPLAAVYTASRGRRHDAAARHCAALSVGPWVDSYQPFTTRSPLPKS